jgi:hypothetical protein
MTTAQLPPAEYPTAHIFTKGPAYTADQMREAITTARREAMEECAVIADAEASVEGIAQRIAAAIRARVTP